MKSDMTILIVNDFDYVQGGASKVAIDTAKNLHDQGFHVIFFSGTHSDKEFVNYGYENISLNIPECLMDKNKIRGALRGIYNFKSKKELEKILKKLDNTKTIIHYHGWTKTLSSSVFKVAFDLNFKTVLTLHDYFSACPNGGFFNSKKNKICLYKGNCKKCVKSNCDSRNYAIKIYRNIRFLIQEKFVKLNQKIKNVIYISDFSWNILKPYFPENINAQKICNPVDIDFEQKVRTINQNEVYLYVGRISKEKGVPIFCKAITESKLKGVVVGDGPIKNELEKEYKNIEFVGWQTSENVKKYLMNSRALIFPSLWYETMGLTALEALSLGIPVLVGNESATSEYIKDNFNGFIYKTGDVEDLKNKLKKCTDKQISFMSENAYNFYWNSPYSKERYIHDLLLYFEEIIK